MSNKKKLLIAVGIILCLTVNIGFTVAYFTDYEAARGGAILHLSGQSEITEKIDGNEKVVTITNTGKTDLVVRVQAFGENVQAKPGDAWAQGSGDGSSWYYYTKVLKAGETTPEIRFAVSGRVDTDDPVDFDVTVVQEAERVVYTQDADGNNVVAAPAAWEGCPAISAPDDSRA